MTRGNTSVTLTTMDSEGLTFSNYELAYHLNPDIEEGEMKNQVQELEKALTENGATVLISREPKKRPLSYPIRKKSYSYFGVLDFNASPEATEKINSQMKLQNQILRFLVLKKPSQEKGLRTLGLERPRPRMKTHEPTAISREAAKSKEEIKPEQLEKEIEEALERI